MLEFCLDLDSQDDRLLIQPEVDARFTQRVDNARWDVNPVFDSREVVAIDLLKYIANPRDASLAPWRKLFADSRTRGADWEIKTGKKIRWDDVQYVASHPVLNGFGPYQNAWTLHKGVGKFAGAYVIAIRGTVFSNGPSAMQDFILNPVHADQFLSPSVRFAQDPKAAIHSGFAHGTFAMLLDEKYGIVPVVSDKVPQGSRIFITGHSQGAALATLVHAFFHFAQADDNRSDVFKLCERNYPLKSYAFAQPKPGDALFAADFARHTQQDDSAIVINNVLDPVPQVPLTTQVVGDVMDYLPSRSLWIKCLYTVVGGLAFLVRCVGWLAEISVRRHASDYGNYYKHDDGLQMDHKLDKSAGTLNFTAAGHVLTLIGTPVETEELFIQHHAYIYRQLLSQQMPG